MHLLSSYSLWWIPPILALAVLISIYFYRKQTWLVSKSKKLWVSLVILRALSLGLIGLLLLGLLLEQTNFETERPVVLTLIDRSSSMMNYKDREKLAPQIKAYQTALQEKLANRFELLTWNFGTNLEV